LARTVVWQPLQWTGLEYCTLSEAANANALSGTVLLIEDGFPWRINYSVECTRDWLTSRALVHAESRDGHHHFDLRRNDAGGWVLNGTPVPDVDGCTDVDLAFTPATNTLPIRRLALAVGGRAGVEAAWLRWPEMTFETLEQSYERVDEERFRYRAGSFEAILDVDDAGLMRTYEGLWARA
jgi:uncharacterized protein